MYSFGKLKYSPRKPKVFTDDVFTVNSSSIIVEEFMYSLGNILVSGIIACTVNRLVKNTVKICDVVYGRDVVFIEIILAKWFCADLRQKMDA